MNALTIDLESWVHAMPNYYKNTKIKKKLDNGFIINATKLLLKILEKHNTKTTFFIVGELFQWYPDLIYEIKYAGHEIGYHTHTHKKLININTLKEELKLSKNFIENFNIKGFRAPEAFIQKCHFITLKDYGFIYDSSTYDEFNTNIVINNIIEASISTYPIYIKKPSLNLPKNLSYRMLFHEIPFGSGYFIGLFGSLTSWFIKNLNKKGKSTNLFIHPWQILNLPSQNIFFSKSIKNKPIMLPYLINRYCTYEYLLSNHHFTTLKQLIGDL